MAVDTSLIGKPVPAQRVVIERGPVWFFARAVTDDNPVYRDPAAARAAGFDSIPCPPTFPFAWAHMGAFPEIQPDNTGVPNPMVEVMNQLRSTPGLILHGEQEFVYHRTPQVGDDLVSEGRIADIYQRESKGRTMTFIVTETTWKDARTGEPVVTAIFNLIHRA
jgi:acyl dehydratase